MPEENASTIATPMMPIEPAMPTMIVLPRFASRLRPDRPNAVPTPIFARSLTGLPSSGASAFSADCSASSSSAVKGWVSYMTSPSLRLIVRVE